MFFKKRTNVFFLIFIIYVGWSYWQFKKYQDLTTAASPATTESFYTDDGELEMNKVRALSRSYAQAIAGIINYYYLFLIILIYL
jgi:predicted negative regulator of RcsB-dependent stress response